MGLLDRFRKEEHVHFERDQAGKVTDVEREYSGQGSRTPVSDRLLRQQRDERQQERKERRAEYRQAYQDSFRKARLQREAARGSRAGSMSWGDRLDKIAGPPQHRQKSSSYSPRNNYNPFGSMFDTGLGYSKPSTRRKKSSKTKYKVIGGKAYPIAGTGKKKKKTTKRKSTKSYDPFNAWGGYKF